MTDLWMLLAGIGHVALCGVAWRVRGSARDATLFRLPASGQLVRAGCAAAMALPLALLDWPLALLLWPALLLGMMFAGWGDAMDIGRVHGERLTDALLMSGWGLVALAPCILLALAHPFAWWPDLHWLPLVVAGLLFGPVYAACWRWGGQLPRVPCFASGPTEWGEALCGAAIGAALVISAWRGG